MINCKMLLSEQSAKPLSWIIRLGRIGFLFFLVKGMLWLSVPALLWLGQS